MNRHTYKLGKQRLGKATDLWVAWYGSSERTTIALDTVMIVILVKFCQAALLVCAAFAALGIFTALARGNEAATKKAKQIAA